jgi:hypothetical protein
MILSGSILCGHAGDPDSAGSFNFLFMAHQQVKADLNIDQTWAPVYMRAPIIPINFV